MNAGANVVPDRTLANYFLGVPFGASVGTVGWNPLTLDADFGYDQRWNIGVQRELSSTHEPRSELRRHEGFESAGGRADQPSPGGVRQHSGPPTVSALRQHEYSQPGAVHRISRAADARLQKRTSGGYWYLVSYTWSQTLTTQPAPGIGGNFTYDTGPAPFDATHLLGMSFGAELPFGRGKRFIGEAQARS